MSARRSSTFTPLPPQPPLPGGGAGVASTPRRTPARNANLTPAAAKHHQQNAGAADISVGRLLSSSTATALPPAPPAPIPTVRLSRLASDIYHPSLDFASFQARIRTFTGAFDGYVVEQLLLTEQEKTDARTELGERQDKLRAARRELESQSRAQRDLWDTVAEERAQDKRLRNAIASLVAQHAALTDRLVDADEEKTDVTARLESRKRVKLAQRAKLEAHRAQNAPELAALQRLLACKIERKTAQTVGGRENNGEMVKFSFGLLTHPQLPSRGVRGLDEQDSEAWFVLDVSRPTYEVPELYPLLPSAKLRELLAELNSSRALYVFVKNMREALELESQRESL
ncbi:kinetochore-associated Ndc80 complex subunit spc25 [Tilletia horrida]|uniref:Kinetochore protein SPC25 n=1 Tax=Tilletia horrida TaxID=155126 RepID=A0AAN6GU72_9BASI|nr:kinetochore-associated Ndc80 complex subunit spc25 [Tilletia horrida]